MKIYKQMTYQFLLQRFSLQNILDKRIKKQYSRHSYSHALDLANLTFCHVCVSLMYVTKHGPLEKGNGKPLQYSCLVIHTVEGLGAAMKQK